LYFRGVGIGQYLPCPRGKYQPMSFGGNNMKREKRKKRKNMKEKVESTRDKEEIEVQG
jgi:hypothetical protein